MVTPQYERIVGGASVKLRGLEPGTTYRIRLWSTDGTSVSSEAKEMVVTTSEIGKEHTVFIAYRNIGTSAQFVCTPKPIYSSVATPEAPSPPRMLTTTGESILNVVELNWLPPLHPNGAIHYEIEYEPAMTPGDPVNAGSSSSPYFTLTLPNEFLTYNVTVAAVNTQGRVESSVLPGLCLGRSREQGLHRLLLCM